ncbi:Ig-like domain-containing protein, partial [Enterococcus hulanensis]
MKNKIVRLLVLLTLVSPNIMSTATVFAEAKQVDIPENSIKTNASRELFNKNTEDVTSIDKAETTNSSTTSKETESSKIEAKKVNDISEPRAPSQTRNVAPNVITNMSITDSTGNPLDDSLGAWDSFRIYGDFKIPNNQVKQGDTTTLTLPDKITFYNTENFDLLDTKGNIVAHAVIDPSDKTIVITYTDYVEKNSDVSGSFYFYARVDTTTVKEKENIDINIDVDGKPIYAGRVDYTGPSEKNEDPLLKYGWIDKDDPTKIGYYLSVNYSKQAYPNATISDRIDYAGGKVDQTSFKIFKGDWVWDTSISDWDLENKTDVTDNYAPSFDADGKGFSVNMGDIKKEDGFIIQYDVSLSYQPVDGEKFDNHATLTSNEVVIKEVTSQVKYQKGGGEAEGYTYTINIQKKDDAGNNLSGAEFEVVRDSTSEKVGSIISDENGKGSISDLLKDNYTIRETKAPSGYKLTNELINVKPEDFDSNKEFYKEVINKKIDPTNIKLNANKVLTGQTLKGNDFEFTLKDDTGKVIDTVKNDGT